MSEPLVFFATVLALGIAAQWMAWRLRLPSILVLLAFGFLVGWLCGDDPQVPGDTITDEIMTTKLLFPIVSLAVAVIMFEGGLTLRFRDLDDSGNALWRLVTVGALISWGLAALAAYWCVGMDVRAATLVGAILVVTGPTVIAPLLRHVRPSRRIGSVIKWEGIVIDPIGAVLAVLVFDAMIIGKSGEVVWVLAKILLVGIGLGWGTALALAQLMRRYWIPDFLHNPVFLAAAVGTFALSNQIAPEAGLVTVTIMGIALANQKLFPVNHVVEFKENLRVLLISCLFIVLAARIRIEDILDLGWGGFAFVAILIFVIRPIATIASTFRSELSWNERWFLSFLAPRGIVAAAVSSIFALELAAHYAHEKGGDGSELILADAERIVSLTFLVIVGTVTFYGLSAAPLARFLGLAVKKHQGVLFAGASNWVLPFAKAIHEEGIQVLMVDTNYRHISEARMIGLPGSCASVVSDYMEEIDLSGIGRLLAVTPNDDLNTLAVMEYAPLFGRAEVYQLPFREIVAGRRETATHNRGRYLFGQEATHSKLAFRIATDSQIKKTKITDEFSYEDFVELYGEDAVLMGVLTETKQLMIATAGATLAPKSGQTVIALVSPSSEKSEA